MYEGRLHEPMKVQTSLHSDVKIGREDLIFNFWHLNIALSFLCKIIYFILKSIMHVMSILGDVLSPLQVNGILVCEAGCILESLDNYLAEKG